MLGQDCKGTPICHTEAEGLMSGSCPNASKQLFRKRIMSLDNPSIQEVLADNYLGLGTTGVSAIAEMWDDLLHERFDDDWLKEIGITKDKLIWELLKLTNDIVLKNKLNTQFS